MSSRRKQSKPIGLIEPVSNDVDQAPGGPVADDEASSSSSSSSNTTNSNKIGPCSDLNTNPAVLNDNENNERTFDEVHTNKENAEAYTEQSNLTTIKLVDEAVIVNNNEDQEDVIDLYTTLESEKVDEAGEVMEGNGIKRKRLSMENNDDNEDLFMHNNDFTNGQSEDCNEFSQDDEDNDDEENEDDYGFEDYQTNSNPNGMYSSPHKRAMLIKNPQLMHTEQTPHLLSAISSTKDSPNISNEDMRVLLMFKCKVCGKGFKHRRSLNRHVKLHSGEKNFHCPYCATAFARSDHLKAHIRTHNNSKPFRCSICQCGYSTQAALKVHIAHHHSKSKFKCVICNDMEFHSQLALEGHIYKIHSKENTELDLDHNDKSEPQMTLVTARMNNKNPRQANYNNSHIDQVSNNNFNNSYNRVQFADINNYQSDPGNEFFDEENVQYEEHAEGGEYGVIKEGNENDEDDLIEYTEQSNEVIQLGKELLNDEEFDDNNERNLKKFPSDNDDVLMQKLDSDGVHRSNSNTETATFIDNYGEDDDDFAIDNNNKQSSESKLDSETHIIFDDKGENDNDDLMIEESLSTEKSTLNQSLEHRIKQAAPKISPKHPHMNNLSNPQRFKPPTLLPGPNIRAREGNPVCRPQTQSVLNTYCEMCNARFSNVESFMAHMRNCHPNVPYRQYIINEDAEPKTILNGILGKGSDVPHRRQASQITAVIGKLGTVNPNVNGGIVIPLNNGVGIHSKIPCNIPECKCHLTGHHIRVPQQSNDPECDSDLFTKESHYTCGKCNAGYIKVTDYMNHLKQEHCVEVYRCVLCKQMQLFDNLNLLKDHFFQVHQSTKSEFFRCKLCPPGSNLTSLFSNVEELDSHVQQIHHSATSHGNRTLNMHLRMPVGAAIQRSEASIPLQVSQQFSNGTTYHNSFNNTNSKCFKCPHCDSDFAQQNSLNQHIQMVHKKPPVFNPINQPSPSPSSFPCQYCRNTFTNRQQLERHVRIHVSSIDLKCNICDKQFTTQESLSQHKLTHCKTFNQTSNNPNGHSDSRILEQPFESPSALAISGKSAICVYCKQTIEDETQFKEHFKRHNNIGQNSQPNKVNSFICIVCRQTLSSNNEYNLHMRHHLRRASASERITSPLNNKSPEKQNEASSETEKSNQELKLRCSKCHVKFEAWQELADHISKSHPKEETAQNPTESLNTDEVSKEIKSSEIKSEKVEAVIEVPAAVARCPEPLEKMSPQASSSTNYEICEICSSKFDSNFKLQAHLLIKHEFGNTNGVFTCPVCDESYSRPENLLAHANVHGHAARIYKCTQCTLAFVFKSQLINHSFLHQPAQHNNSVHQKPDQPAGHFQGPRHQPYSQPAHLTNVINNRTQSQTQNFTNGSIKRDGQIPINARARVLYPTPKPHIQRFRCSECIQVFDSFKTYQIHNQTFHNRTVVLNHGGNGSMQRHNRGNRPGTFHNTNNSHGSSYFNGRIPGNNMAASSTSST